MNHEGISDNAKRIVSEYDIRGGDAAKSARLFSGGNQQKMVLARELEQRPKVLVAAQPTMGLDVGATEYIRNKFLEEQSKGMAILLISTELEEILSLSNRILVISTGWIMGEMTEGEVDIERLGLLMAGVQGSQEPGSS